MSRFLLLVLMFLSFLTLAGCSSSGSKGIDYRNSEITPTLEIPPDLIQVKENKNLKLPGSKVGLETNTGRYVDTGNLNMEASTLPVLDNIKLQGQGDLVWLSIPITVEEAYPLLQDFWSEQGYELQQDEPIMGMMKTRWMESKSGTGSFFTRIIESMRAAESKHQFITRLQRSADKSSSNIFIAHRLQQLVIRQDDVDINDVGKQGWQFIAADPAQEYEMLSRLMVFLGLRDDAAKAQLEKIGTFAARASIKKDENDEVAHMAVTQGFVQTWNRLRHQLDRLGVTPIESQHEGSQGSIVISAAALYAALKQTSATDRASIRLKLEGHGNSDNTRIGLMDDKGSLDQGDEVEPVLQSLLPLLK